MILRSGRVVGPPDDRILDGIDRSTTRPRRSIPSAANAAKPARSAQSIVPRARPATPSVRSTVVRVATRARFAHPSFRTGSATYPAIGRSAARPTFRSSIYHDQKGPFAGRNHHRSGRVYRRCSHHVRRGSCTTTTATATTTMGSKPDPDPDPDHDTAPADHRCRGPDPPPSSHRLRSFGILGLGATLLFPP